MTHCTCAVCRGSKAYEALGKIVNDSPAYEALGKAMDDLLCQAESDNGSLFLWRGKAERYRDLLALADEAFDRVGLSTYHDAKAAYDAAKENP